MAIQTINIGATANDGTGDPLRTAFDKVNDNFIEAYSLSQPVQPIVGHDLLLSDGNVGKNGNTVTANIIYWSAVFIEREVTISRLGFRITTAAAAQNAQLAIYASAAGLPDGSELRATGNLSTASANAYVSEALSSNLTLTPGLYFVGANSGGTPAWFSFGEVDLTRFARQIGASNSQLGDRHQQGWRSPKTFGTWGNVTGDTFTELRNEARVPVVYARIA